MEIAWYGHSCFRIIERGVASIVADPYDASIGYGELKLPPTDIVTVSHDAPGHNAHDLVKKVEHVLSRPGEYEIGGVFITGVEAYDITRDPAEIRRNVVFVYDFDSMTVAHLGDLDHVPGQSEIEQLGPIDVLLLPVGGGGALNSAEAAEVISVIEPSIVVPMHYQTEAVKLDLDPLDKFLKEMGVSNVVEMDTLKISSVGAEEETQIVVLRRVH